MTALLEEAIQKLQRLRDSEQDRYAQLILSELEESAMKLRKGLQDTVRDANDELSEYDFDKALAMFEMQMTSWASMTKRLQQRKGK